jgi:CBS domain containing-hemolysin-like protein
MGEALLILGSTAGLIALSAFFVASEFALIAARPHRLEEAAGSSRSARAALRSSAELTVLLAGAQLGITICTLALGAVTKPAVHHWLSPLLADLGAVAWLADAGGFVLALAIVTFLHLVIGEMAPKSWAISHPEQSATLLALPMRGFMWATRPALAALNTAANRCLRLVGVTATDQLVAGRDPDTLRQLVDHSANVGALDASYSEQLSGALDLQELAVRDLLKPGHRPVAVRPTASVADVQAAGHETGHLRILVEGDDSWAVVHVRDTLMRPPGAGIAELSRPAFELDAATPVYTALARMRESGNHLAIVLEQGRMVGVITLTDVLRKLFPGASGY